MPLSKATKIIITGDAGRGWYTHTHIIAIFWQLF